MRRPSAGPSGGPATGDGVTVSVRDAAATRQRILDAATVEFSALGLAGGRVARIAERARANQRMIYAYFGSKDGLFDAVLEHHILLAQDAVDFDAADLPGYAQQVFDVYRANPRFLRLTLWQTLERPELLRSVDPVVRTMTDKIGAIARAQAAGLVSDALPADRLLDHILALAQGSLTDIGQPGTWTEAQRRDLATSVARLTAPRR
ncbi:MAG TPA: TetR family transcriptional regulator [Pseudonocardia sp.]|jgi:AcrR family transcriptional regulator|nr:TetR family transcriptional regulator [Pseudonocardia sp.]